jgi:hypothetical protein
MWIASMQVAVWDDQWRCYAHFNENAFRTGQQPDEIRFSYPVYGPDTNLGHAMAELRSGILTVGFGVQQSLRPALILPDLHRLDDDGNLLPASSRRD